VRLYTALSTELTAEKALLSLTTKRIWTGQWMNWMAANSMEEGLNSSQKVEVNQGQEVAVKVAEEIVEEVEAPVEAGAEAEAGKTGRGAEVLEVVQEVEGIDLVDRDQTVRRADPGPDPDPGLDLKK